MFSLTLATRYLLGRKLRTFLTSLAVVFGVLVIFGMNIILPSMLVALETNVAAAEGAVDLTLVHVSGEPFPATAFDQTRGVAGVRAAAASLNRTLNIPANFYDHNPDKRDRITALALIGIMPAEAKTVRAYAVSAGRYLEADDTTAALITQTLADALGVKVGDTFPLPTANGVINLTVVGLLPARLSPGNEEVLVPLQQAQAMTNQPGKISVIDINLNTVDEARRTEIAAALLAALGPGYQIGNMLGGAEMAEALRMGEQMMSLFGMLALFIGAFIIFNTFRTVIAERRRDIGMLRALGATRRTITGLILVESLVQGVLGTAAGLALGYLLGVGVLKVAGPLMNQFVNLSIGAPVVSPTILGVSILLGVGVTVCAGLLPALAANKVTPLEALRPSLAEVEFNRQTGASFVAGVALIAVSLLALFSKQSALIGLGSLLFLVGLVLVAPALVRPVAGAFGWLFTLLFARDGAGKLAQGNLTRQPARTAITASASMLSLAVVVAAAGIVASLSMPITDMLKKSLGSDYIFMPPSIGLWNSDIGARPELAQQLRALEGVATVSTERYAGTTVSGTAVALLGIEPGDFQKVSGLRFQKNLFLTDAAAYQAVAEGRALIMNGPFMLAVGAKVGDTVTLATPTGPQPYRVVALAADLFNAKINTAFISQANLQADFGKTEDVFLQLNLKPGADAAAAEKAIRAAAEDYPQFTVIAGKAYCASLLSLMNAAFVGMYFILAILALPSLVATLNTLAISVIERTREIGMLRAVGSTRPQVQRMVLAEALLLAAIGVLFGLLAGLYLGYVFVQVMGQFFPLGYAFPVEGIVAAIVISLSFGALAAIIPARQAARMEIVAALRYE